ncbi:MAG: hypothetical protein OXM62_06035 [bacterium]|nr:hypothetical protein [bacterium]MDE0234548.1 hypothetical protein [bacterium]
MDNRLFVLADLISDNPYITPEEVREKTKWNVSVFWEVVDALKAWVDSGLPLPPRTAWGHPQPLNEQPA